MLHFPAAPPHNKLGITQCSSKSMVCLPNTGQVLQRDTLCVITLQSGQEMMNLNRGPLYINSEFSNGVYKNILFLTGEPHEACLL